jgi:anti-sigma factor RsiW
MKDCVRYAPMIGAREGELDAGEARDLAAHLASCATCRAVEATVRATDGLVAEALLAEAARRDFAPFVDGVMARVAARPAGALGRLRAWLGGHRRLAGALAALPVVAALAVVVYVRTERPARDTLAQVELDSEGDVATVLRTDDGPLVLLGDTKAEG